MAVSSPIRPTWQKVATAISRYPTVWILLLTVLVIIAIWPVPTLLVHSGQLSETDRLKAVADTRSGVIATLTALAGAGGLAYTIATYRLGVADRLIERFENAAAQLGHRNETIRLSGLLAIAQLADESRHQHRLVSMSSAHMRGSPRRDNPRRRPERRLSASSSTISVPMRGSAGPATTSTCRTSLWWRPTSTASI